MKIITLFSPLFLLTASSYCFAQKGSDTAFRSASINNLIAVYYQSIGLQAPLYHGSMYVNYPRRFTEGHQYFLNDVFNSGSVAFDGLYYHNVPLRYDIIRDEISVLEPYGIYPINLLQEKVDSFSFEGHRFYLLKKDSIHTASPQPGFYEKLYSGKVELLAKRHKHIQEINASTIEIKVYERVNYYLIKNRKFHLIKNGNALVNMLHEKGDLMKEYIKKNNFRLRKAIESDLINLITYYDQLK